MLFNNMIFITLFFYNKNLESVLLAKFAYGLDVRKCQGFFLTLLAT